MRNHLGRVRDLLPSGAEPLGARSPAAARATPSRGQLYSDLTAPHVVSRAGTVTS